MSDGHLPNDSRPTDDLSVTDVCNEYISRCDHGESYALVDAIYKLESKEERLEALSDLLPYEIDRWEKQYHRRPCCEELALSHPELRDEIFSIYGFLDDDLKLPQRIGPYRIESLARLTQIHSRRSRIGR